MVEHLADILKSHALDFWIAEVNHNLAENANSSVETGSARRRRVFHLRQESGSGDDV